MTTSALPHAFADPMPKPAAWLVAAGIVAAITTALSCLVILV